MFGQGPTWATSGPGPNDGPPPKPGPAEITAAAIALAGIDDAKAGTLGLAGIAERAHESAAPGADRPVFARADRWARPGPGPGPTSAQRPLTKARKPAASASQAF